MEGTMDSSEGPSGQTEPAESTGRRAGADAETETAAGTGIVTGTGAVAETGTVTVTGPVAETRGARFARKAHRTRLYLYAGAAVVLLVFLIALVLANTGHVKVSWVFGTSSVSLVWLVLGTAILGLLLGMVLGALFHWRTRRPRG
jgi:uncharacterized integral membrane protein